MRVLYIGNYRDSTGWASFGINQILALDVAGLDVICRAMKLNQVNGQIPERIRELEDKPAGKVDVVIEQVLPHYLEYHVKAGKNIASYLVETSNFISSTWNNHINLMDEGWVCCQQNKKASEDSGVTIPIRVVPMATDVTKFQRSYQPLDLKENFKDKFIFYTIGEFTKRKNIVSLLRAFHTEFDPDEPVELMIKTTPIGIPGNPAEHIQKMSKDIKNGLKLYGDISRYKPEIIICQHLPEEMMAQVHMTGDCFVTASHGEAWCIPAFEALGYGKPVICPDHGGFREYMNDSCGWVIPTYEDDCFGAMDSFNDLYTAREQWNVVSVPLLRKAMREAYENKQLFQEKQAEAMARVYDFTYEKVGNIMKELLV